MSLLRTFLLSGLAAALLVGLSGAATALPIQAKGPPDGVPASDKGNDQGLALGNDGELTPPGLDEPVVDPQNGTNGPGTNGPDGNVPGPPDPFPASPNAPVSVEQLEDGFMISISHPNASKLGFLDPFISLQIRPGSGPDTVTFVAKPPATIPEPSTLALALIGIGGLVGLAGRRRVRS